MKITKDEKEIFDYLNELRESGEVNMFAAGRYISNQFGTAPIEAGDLLLKWMDNFNEDGYDHLLI